MEIFHQLIIRLAQITDAVKLKGINDLFNEKDDTTLSELETSLRENKNEIVVCADIGTSIVGICYISIISTVGFNWRYCFITELFVREEYRKRGIGKAMMKFAEDELIKIGIKKTFLWVGESNKKARKLYTSLGFIEMADTIMCMREY